MNNTNGYKSFRVVLAVAGVIVLVFGALMVYWHKESSRQETIQLLFDWEKDIPPFAVTAGTVPGISIKDDFVLCSVYPYAENVSVRYFKQIRLRFEAKGEMVGKPVDILCYAVVTPKLQKGDHVRLSLANVGEVEVKVYDSKGKELSCDSAGLQKLFRSCLPGHVLDLGSVTMPDGLEVEACDLWANARGLECRADVRGK